MTSRIRHTLALSAAGLATLAAAFAVPQLGARVLPAVGALGDASRPWLGVAALGFLAAFVCTVGAWHTVLTSAGARICPRQAAARLGIGAMVNSFAPAKIGDAVKIALCSRAIDAPGRLWTAGGAYAALTATRALTLSALVVVASLTGAMPLWPVFVLVGGATAVGVAAALSIRFRSHPHVAQLLDGVAALARSPRTFATVVAWTVGMQLARVAGTIGAAVALGLPHPVLAALVILPALDVAGAIPLTPGSIGIGSGAVAVVLASRGIGITQAIAVGFAIQTVETLVSVCCGATGLAYLLRPSARVRLIAGRIAVVGASAALGAVVGVEVVGLF
ncbi:MAG TPA: lysylphosphatidylglycerol synthase domain-containing protein [Gaiellaceae bacterium]|nr:lysylphosphatidylglycerol synthase domain-containing protein [Gaiellaceae bacterium]